MKKGIVAIALLLTIINLVSAQTSSCQAGFNFAVSGQTVVFTDTSSGNITPTDWNWNFGDGEISGLQSPVHTYSQPGIYVVCLTVYKPFTNCQSTYCDSITVTAANSCFASYIYNKDTANGTIINFYDSSSPDSASYSWSFGDSTTDSVKNPIHSFAYAGTYNVCLTVVDTSGCTSSFCQNVYAGNVGCSAHFTYSHDTINTHGFNFLDDSQGAPSHWIWTFGNNDTSLLQAPSHVFGGGGYYNICLTIYDSSINCTDTYCEYIQVNNCYAQFAAVNDSVNPRVVTFTDESLGNVTGWHWDFEDGTTSDLQNPVHTYPFDAWHDVCLTVSDSIQGCSSKFCKMIYAGTPSSCYEYWEYHPDSLNPLSIQFFEMSWGSAPSTFLWHFGDGDSSYVRNPTHVYASEGEYFVCCTISDSTGTCSYSDCYNLHVGEGGICHAHFNYSVLSGTIVSFVDSSYGVSPSNYVWSFGDNYGNSSQLNPYNNFNAPGTYYVCLTITDTNSICNSTYCDSIVVPENTGILELSNQNDIVVYPNPAKDNLYIQNLTGNSEMLIKIFNPLGELLEQYTVLNNQQTIDLSHKPSGLYLVSVQTSKGVTQKRVLVTK